MNTLDSKQALVFAELVQGGLRIGVNLASEAFMRRDAEFFEKCVADQARLKALALSNRANRVSFEEWQANALAHDAVSIIHEYDTAGEIKRLNAILFSDEHARAYYDHFVVPAFDMTEEKLIAAFDTQTASLQSMVDLIRGGELGKEDDNFMDGLQDALNKELDKATPAELIDVLKR